MSDKNYLIPKIEIYSFLSDGQIALMSSKDDNTFTNSYAGNFEENIWE